MFGRCEHSWLRESTAESHRIYKNKQRGTRRAIRRVRSVLHLVMGDLNERERGCQFLGQPENSERRWFDLYMLDRKKWWLVVVRICS